WSIHLNAALAQDNFWYRDNNHTPHEWGDDRLVQREHNGYSSVSVLPQVELPTLWGGRLTLRSFHGVRWNQLPGPVGLPQRADLAQNYHIASAQAVRQTSHANWVVTLYGWDLHQSLTALDFQPASQARWTRSSALGVSAV